MKLVMYNDYRPDESTVMAAGGHARNSIHNLKSGVFTRGILMDIPRLHGLPYLDPETPIYVEDLEAWERAAGVRVAAGDAVFIRTGRWAAREVLGPFRIGRTGRAGAIGSAVSLLTAPDLAYLKSVELLLGRTLERVHLPEFDYSGTPVAQRDFGAGRKHPRSSSGFGSKSADALSPEELAQLLGMGG